MKISMQWLTELVPHGLPADELMEALTMAGLEVDGFAPVASDCSDIVVGEVLKVESHPDADKLSVCEVSDGNRQYSVVCGAANVRPGLKTAFALTGAVIKANGNDKPFKIKPAKIRGIESNGMLCSAEELGLEDKSDGIIELPDNSPVGQDIRVYLQLDDISIELDLTPNRGDCLGMRGVAREVGVLTRTDPELPEAQAPEVTLDDSFPIEIVAKDACPRYLGRVIKGINLEAVTPLWMQERLRRSGLRSIDPIVDVTNYVLIELGQPMHAFDLARLECGIKVRMAEQGEAITLLDGKKIILDKETLVIADHGKAVALAGIMGGEHSAVSDSTAEVLLECAYFSPLAVAGRARQHGMHTDASHRYERGVDYALQQQAMDRATSLLLEIAGGAAGPVVEALGNLPEPATIKLRYSNIERLLGITIPVDEVCDILQRLGFELESQEAEHLVVRAPSFRFDTSIEADLIEELARIYGYNNVPSNQGLSTQFMQIQSESQIGLSRLKAHLTTLGYQEVVTYSFIEPKLCDVVCPDANTVSLQNPISEEMSVMRPSILPGLLSTLRYNANRQCERMKLFETGLVFSKAGEDNKIVQENRIAGLLVGTRNPINWLNNKELHDFYDVKGDIESLLGIGIRDQTVLFTSAGSAPFHGGQCAAVILDSNQVGLIGALHPAIQRELELPANVYLFELNLDVIEEGVVPHASSLSKFPEVSRDLAIVIDEAIPAADVMGLVRENAGEDLTDVRIFDVYQGDAVTKGKKSLALGLTWQHPSRTLSDEEINDIISSCVNALQNKFNANLRN